MIRRQLGNYDNFRCIADKCPATCCSGWGVEIDEESLERYKRFLPDGVDWEEESFKQQPDGDCFFLNSNKLCNMYIEYGEESLCRTCTMYPRHIEEFPGVREYSLSLSCPVVAMELMAADDGFTVIRTLPEDEEEEQLDFEEFNEELYELLLEARELILPIAKEEDSSFEKKSAIIENLLKIIQEKIDDGASGAEIISELKAFDRMQSEASVFQEDPLLLFDIWQELEPLQANFHKLCSEAGEKVESWLDNGELEEKIKAFKASHKNTELILGWIMLYFIYTYLCGAVYDDYVYGMGEVAVFSANMILLLWVYAEQDKQSVLSEDEMAALVYLYSRELEHSTDNMIKLEQLLDEYNC